MVKVYFRRRGKKASEESKLGLRRSPRPSPPPSPVRRVVRRRNIKPRGVGRLPKYIPAPRPSYQHGRHGLKGLPKPRDLNYKDNHGMPLLHRAVGHLNLNEVRNLLVAGADPNITDNDDSTALHALVDYYRTNDEKNTVIEIARWLLFARCDPNKTDSLGNSVLHLAFKYKLADFVLFLFNYKTSLDIVNKQGLDPICYGLSHWSISKRRLVTYGWGQSKITSSDNNIIKFFTGSIQEQLRCLNLAVYGGANLRNKLPLLCSLAGIEHSKIIDTLLKNGVQIDFQHPYVKGMLRNFVRGFQVYRIPERLMWYAALYENNPYGGNSVINFRVEELGRNVYECYCFMKQQVEFMKRESIIGSIKIIELINDRTAEKLAHNNDVQRTLMKLRASHAVPNYIDFLEKKMIEARNAVRHQKEAYKALERILGLSYHSYHPIYHRIMSSLTSRDINNLRAIVDTYY